MGYHENGDLTGYGAVADRLTREFAGVHDSATVTRYVAAARYGARDVTGSAAPDLVERIARKHLRVLAAVAAEKRRQAAPGLAAPQSTPEHPV
ncbi:hypothetical protein SAMN04489712_11591 [Thermomonospora echinospora]|uniref:Uncharacterized protein n=2 Tax=Thermomonospora echinospora TaxID=1992 RepID=A0A1H6DBJ6_9ACTN|nr:hypothetical protein [Thermomonospora echinospora]SEG82827.1 hypothetical protein SAMN04489712_11591 [Thermomonospora echinospora]